MSRFSQQHRVGYISTSISAKQYVNINDEKADNQWGVMKSLILE